jgi:hypothetical protein
LKHEILPHTQGGNRPQEIGGSSGIEIWSKIVFCLKTGDDLARAGQSMLQAILPGALRRRVQSPNGVHRARRRPYARIHACLKRGHFTECRSAAGSICYFLNFLRQIALLVGMPDQRDQKVGSIREVKVNRLSRDLRRCGDIRHRDASIPAFLDESQGGIQNPVSSFIT